jgi:hypothetical protein
MLLGYLVEMVALQVAEAMLQEFLAGLQEAKAKPRGFPVVLREGMALPTALGWMATLLGVLTVLLGVLTVLLGVLTVPQVVMAMLQEAKAMLQGVPTVPQVVMAMLQEAMAMLQESLVWRIVRVRLIESLV